QGNGNDAARHAARAVELAERSNSHRSLAVALAEHARLLMLAGDYDKSIAVGERAIAIAEAAGLEDVAVGSLVTVGTARGNNGDPSATELLERAFERARAAVAPTAIFRALNNQVYLVQRRDGFAASAALRERLETEAVDRFRILSFRRWFESIASFDLYLEGDWDESLRRMDSFFRSATEPHYLDGEILLVRAMIETAREEDEAAWADMQRGLDAGRDVGDPQHLGPALAFGARVSLLLGRVDDARRYAEELLALPGGAATFAADGSTELAWLCVDLGLEPRLEGPLPSVWRSANQAILGGRIAEAIGILDRTGARAEAAYARLRRARLEPGPWLDEAEAFYSEVRAIRFLREVAGLKASTRRSA